MEGCVDSAGMDGRNGGASMRMSVCMVEKQDESVVVVTFLLL